jgi:hypothetical protein
MKWRARWNVRVAVLQQAMVLGLAYILVITIGLQGIDRLCHLWELRARLR